MFHVYFAGVSATLLSLSAAFNYAGTVSKNGFDANVYNGSTFVATFHAK